MVRGGAQRPPRAEPFLANCVKTELIWQAPGCSGVCLDRVHFGVFVSCLKSAWPHQEGKSAVSQVKPQMCKMRIWPCREGELTHRSAPSQNLVLHNLLEVELFNLMKRVINPHTPSRLLKAQQAAHSTELQCLFWSHVKIKLLF